MPWPAECMRFMKKDLPRAKKTRTDHDLAPGHHGNGTNPLASFLPLYIVIFVGFVGYSLMITVLTPALMSNHNLLLAAGTPMRKRIVLLSFLLCLYPLGQFVGSPIVGSLSDRFGRKPVLLVSLTITTVCYALIVLALSAAKLCPTCYSLAACGYGRSEYCRRTERDRRCGQAGRPEPFLRLHLHER